MGFTSALAQINHKHFFNGTDNVVIITHPFGVKPINVLVTQLKTTSDPNLAIYNIAYDDLNIYIIYDQPPAVDYMIYGIQVALGNTISNTPAPVGDIFNFDNAGFDSVAFDTPVGSPSVNFNGNSLGISGGDGSYNHYVTVDWPTAMENCVIDATYQVQFVPGASSYGVGFGFQSQNANQANHFRAYYVCSTGPLFGKVIVDMAGIPSPLNIQSVGAVPPNQNDMVRFQVFRTPLGYDCIATNITQSNAQVTLNIVCSPADPISGPVPHNTSKVAIYALGGAYEIFNHRYANVGDNTFCKAMVIADSKGSYCATTQAARTIDILQTAGHTAVLNWGVADRTIEAVMRIKEILKFSPLNVFIDIGCNDIRNGISSVVYQANLRKLYYDCLAGGATVFFVTPSCETPVDVTPIRTYEIATWPTKIVDIFPLTTLGGNTNPDPLMVSSDDIHVTDALMQVKADEIESVLQ